MRRRFFYKIDNFITQNYLTIESLEYGLTASLSVNECEYCVDGDGNWKTLAAGTATESINSGQTLSFRGNLKPSRLTGIGRFTISRKCNLKGNCMSMLFGDNAADNFSLEGKDNAFYRLFESCWRIVAVSKSFLPATILAHECYVSMFSNCTSLTTAPELPATILAYHCYQYMFSGCSNLNYIKMLATDISATNCLVNWVKEVPSGGIFVKNPAMTSLPTATSSNNYAGIPSGWTVVNDGEESGGNLITFTIAGTEYQAEKGMTWGEWVDSEYNMGNFAHNGINFVGNRVCDVSGNQINDNTILHDGDFYSLLYNSDGDY